MPATATLVPDRPAIRLSGTLTLKATLEGPAPLRVDAPVELLSEDSAPAWRIEPVGSAKLVELPDGRQRWSQDYKLSPFAAGPNVPLGLREFTVAAGDDAGAKPVAFPILSIQVDTVVRNIKPEEARPATGIEVLPPLPAPEPFPFLPVGITVAALLLLAAGAYVALRRRRPVPAPTPGERALRKLDALPPDDSLPERLAAILRVFTAARFGLPAETMTTAELAKARPDEALTAILEACDKARFAGAAWPAEDGSRMVERGRAWVERFSNERIGSSEPEA